MSSLFEPDAEAGLKQPEGVANPEFYRRRAIAPPPPISRFSIATWRASRRMR
jgi:hypothetical protein